MKCPCESGRSYDACCAVFHKGQSLPSTPEELMKSRYTAFVLEKTDYLVSTTTPDRRTPQDRSDLNKTFSDIQWTGLKVLTSRVPPNSEEGTVEFVATYRERTSGFPGSLHEWSVFKRLDGKWYYDRGFIEPDIPPKANALCWCGSGRKFKHCHRSKS